MGAQERRLWGPGLDLFLVLAGYRVHSSNAFPALGANIGVFFHAYFQVVSHDLVTSLAIKSMVWCESVYKNENFAEVLCNLKDLIVDACWWPRPVFMTLCTLELRLTFSDFSLLPWVSPRSSDSPGEC